MPEYRFSYLKGQSKPSLGITAANDYDAFKQMRTFVEEGGFTYVPGSMMSSKSGFDYQKVPEPHPQIDEIREQLKLDFEKILPRKHHDPGLGYKPLDSEAAEEYIPYNDHMR